MVAPILLVAMINTLGKVNLYREVNNTWDLKPKLDQRWLTLCNNETIAYDCHRF